MSNADPHVRLRWIEKLAAAFPGERSISMSLVWENDHGQAGIHSYPNERAIIADEVVAVTAYANERLVYSGLAPANDPSSGFSTLDGHGGGDDAD